MRFTVSLAQMHIEQGKPQENLKKAVEFIQAAGEKKCNFILLPELWSSGFDLDNAGVHAQQTPEIITELGRLAKTHQICIGGSLLESSTDGIYNTFTWIDPMVSHPIRYRKVHLFGLMSEMDWLKPGTQPVIITTPWGLSGLGVCYDLRFPELFRRYALDGARAFILSAEWPTRRIEHWKILARARAIENQCFLFAVNCVGKSPNDQFGGCSVVVSPWGDVLAEGNRTDEMLIDAGFETDQVEQARIFMPVIQDRRPDVYTSTTLIEPHSWPEH